jgi:hypothetical protein
MERSLAASIRRCAVGHCKDDEPALDALELSFADGHRLEGGGFPFRTPGKKDKPLQHVGLWRADRDEKARSVVALSRDPPLKRSSPVRLRLPVF